MDEFQSSENEMSDLTWASGMLHERVATQGSVKERIRTAARTLKWNYSRTKAVWYADERIALKAKELRRIEEVTGVEYGRKELRDFNDLIAKADVLAALQEDESVYSAFAAAFGAFVSALHRAGTRGGNSE